MEDQDDLVFESLQKTARKSARRGVRWSVRSGNTLRSDGSLIPHKRPHSFFTILNRDEEEAANGGRPYHYTYVGNYAGASRARRGVPTEENPNPNRTGPSSVVTYSLDKRKNWEELDSVKKDQRRRKLAMSYSDTDDISTSDSSDDDIDTEIASIPKVVVLESNPAYNGDLDPTSTNLMQKKFADRFLDKSIVNTPLDEVSADDPDAREAAELEKFRISKGRKGFVVRERRTKGKKGVKKSTHHNTHAEQIYDLAKADALIVAMPGARLNKYAHSHSHYADCRCSSCNSPRQNAYIRAKVKKEMLNEL